MSDNFLIETNRSNLSRIHEKRFTLSRSQGKIDDVKWDKSVILISLAIIELFREQVITISQVA